MKSLIPEPDLLLHGKYICEGDEIRVPSSFNEWLYWFVEINNRRVRWTDLKFAAISTVCLGIDHGMVFDPNHVLLLFETCVFVGNDSEVVDQYSSREGAVKGHRLVVWSALRLFPGRYCMQALKGLREVLAEV